MKTTGYIWCFIDMSLYNNFNEESMAHELWEKIGIMFQNKNICGPMLERSLGGSQYFITCVDDCTQKLWAYWSKSKDQVLEIFVRWLVKVENRWDT